MNKFTSMFKSMQKSITKHSPEILTGIGIAGMVTTTVLAVKATPKALQLIEDEKNRQNYEKCKEARDNGYEACEHIDRLPVVDMIKVAWKPYIPAAVTCVASVACLIGASSVSLRRNAALATAYKLSETALTEYRDSVVETIGEKKEQAVRDKVAEKQIQKNPVTKNEVIVTGTGETLCFDPLSGRYFKSDIERIKRAENEINKHMLHDITGYASLNEFYDEIGLAHTDLGDYMGWNTENLVDLDISSHVSDNGQPSIVLVYINKPVYEYDR